MSLQTLVLDSQGPVLEIKLNRPDVRNAFNEVLISELTQVFKEKVTQPDVRAVVLSGEGSVFSAGGDLNWMKKSVQMNRTDNLKDTRLLTQMFSLMNQCPKPLIGLVQGAAIGGGIGLVSVCDIVIAEKEAQFSLSEVRLGLVPACIGPFVISKIGASHARRFFISGERFKADTAKDIGLVHKVVNRPEEMRSELKVFLDNILQCAPGAIAHAKELVSTLSWPEKRTACADSLNYVSEMLADLRVSPEGQEGVKAFLEKRKPSWIP